MTSAEDAGPMSAPATLAGVVGVAGAVVQLGYGFMATAWPYPTITDPPYEVTWAVVNIGMVATVVGLALLVQPRFGRLALAGAALAIAGHLARITVAVLSAIGLADEGTAADGPIVVSILGMFGGMAILSVATVQGHVLQGWRSWLPSAVVATGLVTAAFYSIDWPAYFVMLGLLWGRALTHARHRCTEPSRATDRGDPIQCLRHPTRRRTADQGRGLAVAAAWVTGVATTSQRLTSNSQLKPMSSHARRMAVLR